MSWIKPPNKTKTSIGIRDYSIRFDDDFQYFTVNMAILDQDGNQMYVKTFALEAVASVAFITAMQAMDVEVLAKGQAELLDS